jgi:hypothetical protein
MKKNNLPQLSRERLDEMTDKALRWPQDNPFPAPSLLRPVWGLVAASLVVGFLTIGVTTPSTLQQQNVASLTDDDDLSDMVMYDLLDGDNS